MEELKIIKITKDNSTGNKKLDTCINTINNEFLRGINASHVIARQLQKIRDEELYTATGAESFSEFSEKWFNMSRSQASRLASISEKFLHEKMIDADTGKAIEDNTDDSGSDDSGSDDDGSGTNNVYDIAIQALKDRIRKAISYDITSDEETYAEDAYKNVLEWIDELF